MDILAIGGLNLDVLGQSGQRIVFGDSNPGRVRFRAGGVCHNIAAELRRLGCAVTLISCLGSGLASDLLRSVCQREGIDTSLCVGSGDSAGVYLGIHGPDGDMTAAVNDMAVMDRLTPEVLLPRLEGLGADMAVLDCNLPEETLVSAVRALEGRMPLFLDPVSAFKADRCLRVLPKLDGIKPNLAEARHLTGCRDADACAEVLLGRGVRNVFISLGAEGVYYASREERGRCPARPLPEGTPLTGAGDALCAGLILGMLSSLSASECARRGTMTAAERLTRTDPL